MAEGKRGSEKVAEGLGLLSEIVFLMMSFGR